MVKQTLTGLGLMALVACGAGKEQQQAAADSLQRDLALAPAESLAPINDQPAAAAPAPKPAQPRPAAPKPATPAPSTPAPSKPAPAYGGTLANGTEIVTTANDSIHSRHNKIGDPFHATVSADIKDANGRTVIPAGAVVTFRVIALEPATSKKDKDGKLRVEASKVTVDGVSYALAGLAIRDGIEHDLVGQGVTAGGAVRVGAGAVGGAVAGKVVGGKTGAIIGGIAGAAGGAILANQTADRDVVVAPGMKVIMNLTSNFTLTPQ